MQISQNNKLHTCGNATLIIESNGNPIIATDPWLHTHTAYFGSWRTSHKIPKHHMDLLERCPYYWISHFHPDHLNLRSLLKLKAKNKTIFLSNQYYNRVASDLRKVGIKVVILPTSKYINLEHDIEIATFPILNSIDSALLIKINGCLIVNLNDAVSEPASSFVRKEIASSKHSLLLKLAGYGDADMINVYNSQGKFLEPAAASKPAPGYLLTRQAKNIGCTHAMHFSSFHKYVRSDSSWANAYTTPESDLERGWDSKVGYFKQFSSILISSNGFEKTNSTYPDENDSELLDPKKFGDDWQQEPSVKDIKIISDYLQIINKINNKRSFLAIKVGTRIINSRDFDKNSFHQNRFILHAPRMSIVRAIRSNIFDDLLIGNFARLIIPENNYINYNLILRSASKYHDNAGIKNADELKHFLSVYRGSFDSNYQLINYQLKTRARDIILSRFAGKKDFLGKLKLFYQLF